MHWLWSLWFNYTYPSLKGNGPEAICQTLVYGVLAVILIPPVRRFVRAEFAKVHTKIDHSHELLQHVIKHSPDIPDFPRTNTPDSDSNAS